MVELQEAVPKIICDINIIMEKTQPTILCHQPLGWNNTKNLLNHQISKNVIFHLPNKKPGDIS